MENLAWVGRWLIIAGLLLTVAGSLLWLPGKIPGLHNFPGTLRFEGSGFTCVFPLLGFILVSVLLMLIINVTPAACICSIEKERGTRNQARNLDMRVAVG